MSHNIKEQIKLYMSAHEFLCDKRIPTDAQWDKYFIENYSNNVSIEFYDDNEKEFITYGIYPDHILIKDFIAFGNGLSLFKKVLLMGKDSHLPIKAFVHFSNNQVLNILLKRYNFKIIDTIGCQYLVERGV